MNKIVPLWSVPRSISTGFERMMFERGDFKVIHEPLLLLLLPRGRAQGPRGHAAAGGSSRRTFEGTPR